MGLARLTQPTRAPVATTDLRRWVGWDESDDTHDELLQALALDATDMIERRTRRALLQQTWRWSTAVARVYEVPRPPLISVDSFVIYDRDGGTTTVESSDYQLITGRSPALIVMNDSWSQPESRINEPTVIEFTAGYGAAGDEDDGEAKVPLEVKTLIQQIVTMNFENRGDTAMGFGTALELPMHVQARLRGLAAGTSTGFFGGRV